MFKLVILLTLSSSKLVVTFFDFAQVTIDFICLFLLFWAGRSYFNEFRQDIDLTKNSRTTHRFWHKTFSMIHTMISRNQELAGFPC